MCTGWKEGIKEEGTWRQGPGGTNNDVGEVEETGQGL